MWVLSAEERAGRVGAEEQKSQSVTCPLLSPELCGLTVPTRAREPLQLQLSSHFFLEGGGKAPRRSPAHSSQAQKLGKKGFLKEFC